MKVIERIELIKNNKFLKEYYKEQIKLHKEYIKTDLNYLGLENISEFQKNIEKLKKNRSSIFKIYYISL
jgi:hypothetical protein